ncbi:MAG: hypothetical protein ABI361_02560 [Nitrososphaera sp.]
MTGDAASIASLITGNYTLILLLIALPLFGWLAASARKVTTFQFQISIFILIWIIGELADVAHDAGIVSIQLGLEIHISSMLFFAVMLWVRFLRARKFGRSMIETGEENLS